MGVYNVSSRQTTVDKVEKDLADLKFPDAFLVDLCSVLRKSRDSLSEAAEARCASLPELESFTWRTDVKISTDSMQRMLEPSLLMRIVASDGTRRTFACDTEQFEQLRFGVAQLLSDLNAVESLPILRLQQKK